AVSDEGGGVWMWGWGWVWCGEVAGGGATLARPAGGAAAPSRHGHLAARRGHPEDRRDHPEALPKRPSGRRRDATRPSPTSAPATPPGCRPIAAARACSAAAGGPGRRPGGGGRGGGGGRRSDAALKHDVVLLGRLDNGLGFYRFSYVGSDKAYVGVLAQEVQAVAPEAVVRGSDGYLRVYYEKLGLPFQTY